MNEQVGDGTMTLGPRRTTVCGRTLWAAAIFVWLGWGPAWGAVELSAADLRVRPNGQGEVVVSGVIGGEVTYGVTIMVELVPRPGSRGTVEFTPAIAPAAHQPASVSVRRTDDGREEVQVAVIQRTDVDISQRGDPWPKQGSFTPFDTDATASPLLNGAVDDNGTFVGEPTTFTGALAIFPVRAGADAQGTWDVVLSTSQGNSNWENVPTALASGTLTVTPKACTGDPECGDDDPCTIDTCSAGSCAHRHQEGTCASAPPKRRVQSRETENSRVE